MRRYFQFSPRERSALLLLTGSILLGQGVYWLRMRSIPQGQINIDFIEVDTIQVSHSVNQDDSSTKITPHPIIPANKSSSPVQIRDTTVSDLASKSSSKYTVGINTATKAQLMVIKGIGPAYARRILAFRDALGGFYKIDQIADTYYFPDSVFQRVKKHMKLVSPVRKLKINTATPEAIARHPYLSWKEANLLVDHVRQEGAFQEFEEVRALFGSSKKDLQQLEPYLSYE